MNDDINQKEFQNPPAKYRAKPFWAWNGRLEKTELLRQIDVFHRMGFGGFFMHSRTGLETEYLGDTWFQETANCIEYAEESGMEPWLYDEDRWPSGSAGGLATENHRYRASFLQVEQWDALDWEEINSKDEHIVGIFACQMNKSSFSEKRLLKEGSSLRNGETALIFSIVEAPCKEVYNGNTYLDTMNLEASEHFIELTHEKYRDKLTQENLESVCGIFTDEPHRGPMFTTFNGGNEQWVPYTPKLFESFSKKYGYDLREYLPELFFCNKGDLLSKTTYQYIELCQELFLENFAKPMQDWCHKNKMKLTGHVLHEDSLIAQTLMQGSLMRFYEYMDIPGIDHLLRDNCCFWIVKQVVSVAKQLGKTQILSELYGATGWKATLEEYKQIGDWQALFGINLRCPHLAWYTMQGEAKRDYPASISYHVAGWKEYRYLEDYFSRIHVFLEQGEENEGLLVISPIESVWARSYSGAYDGLNSRDHVINQIEKEYETLFNILTRHQIGFDYGDEGLMEQHAFAENGLLKIGACNYHKVIVCGMYTMRGSTLKLLQEFQTTGGTVVFIGTVPNYVDVEPSSEVVNLAKDAIQIAFDKEHIIKSCEEEKILSVFGEGSEDILVCQRKDSGGSRYMLLNQNRIEEHKKIQVRFRAIQGIEEWNARTGEVTVLACERSKDGHSYITVDFAPGEEKLFRILLSETSKGYESQLVGEEIVTLPETYSYRLSEKNICVLDKVSAYFASSDGVEHRLDPMEVLRADREFRKVLGKPMRGGEMLQPWYRIKHEQGKECPQSVTLCYSFILDKNIEMLELVLENTDHIRQIRLNGMSVLLSYKKQWIDQCYGQLELPVDLLKNGHNEIEVEQEFIGQDGFEAVYLQGDFSVYLKDGRIPVLGELPRQLKLGDVTQQGLPFYSGEITYCLPEMKEYQGRLKITAKDWKGWTMTVVDIQGKEHFIGFAPYTLCCDGLKEIRLFLTRKNTFGPLHETNPDPALCEPNSFLTTGEYWSESYVLQPQGIMNAPIVEAIKVDMN